MIPCSLVVRYRRFGESCCLVRIPRIWRWQVPPQRRSLPTYTASYPPPKRTVMLRYVNFLLSCAPYIIYPSNLLSCDYPKCQCRVLVMKQFFRVSHLSVHCSVNYQFASLRASILKPGLEYIPLGIT